MAYIAENQIPSRADAATISNTFAGDSKEVALFLPKKAAFREFYDAFAYKFRYFTTLIVQSIASPFFYVIFHTFFNLEIRGQEHIKGRKAPLIFISNHIGFYDSFMFDIFTPPLAGISPFRFMGTTQLDVLYLKLLKYTGIIHLVYLLFGVVNITYGKGAERTIKPLENIIKRGGTVAIFPEGKIWAMKDNSEKIGPFKWGAAMLAKNTGGTVVPVALNKAGKKLFRDRLIVSIGEPFKVDEFDTPEDIADDMRQVVLKLYQGSNE